MDRPLGGAGLEQRAPVLARAVVPALDLARLEPPLHLVELAPEAADLLDDRGAVRAVDVAPDRRVRARHARHVAEARAHLPERLAVLREPRRGLGGEHVGEHVRQVAEHGHEPVVRRPRPPPPGARRGPRRSGGGARTGGRRTARAASGTRPRPGRGRRGRAPRPRSRRRRSGGPPTKRGSAVRLTRSCFVEPTSVTSVSSPDASSAARTSSGSAPTGAQTKHSSAPSTASSSEPAARSDGAALERDPQPLGVAAEAHDLRALDVLRAARPIEPPISPTPRTAIRIRTRPSKTACRPAPPPPRACAGTRRSRPRRAPAGRRRRPPRVPGGSRR